MKNPDFTKILYFLRGLGVGIVVTTLVVTIHNATKPASSINNGMSKEEIMEKAKEYGLVEPIDNKLDEILGSSRPSESLKPEEKNEPKETKIPAKTPIPAKTATPAKTPIPEKTSIPENR